VPSPDSASLAAAQGTSPGADHFPSPGVPAGADGNTGNLLSLAPDFGAGGGGVGGSLAHLRQSMQRLHNAQHVRHISAKLALVSSMPSEQIISFFSTLPNTSGPGLLMQLCLLRQAKEVVYLTIEVDVHNFTLRICRGARRGGCWTWTSPRCRSRP